MCQLTFLPFPPFSYFLSLREISFVVEDDAGSTSQPAYARVTFNPTDDPPLLDLNGNEAGLNYSVFYTEGMMATKVVCVCSDFYSVVYADKQLHISI